jgi:hypothetical protein
VGIRQTSFASGELAPELWGRSDLPSYASGARRLRNFFPSRHGALVSRPGSFQLGASKGNGYVRLVPFIYSDTTAYVLMFSGGPVNPKITIFLQGAQVAEIVSPYYQDDVTSIRWVQSGNVLTITCPFHPPRLLTRVDNVTWTIADVDFSRPSLFTLTGATAVLKTPIPTGDATHVAREWQWLVTGIKRDSKGVVTESAPLLVFQDDAGNALAGNVAVYPDTPVTLKFPSVGTVGTDPNLLGFLIYRGRAGLFGLVGSTNTNTFTDVGEDPDYTTPPPQGLNPFKQKDAAGNALPLETPTAVSYFEERLTFGGTNYASGGEPPRPGHLFFSATGDYYNFDERLVPVASEALLYELAARKREVIRHLLATNKLLVFTSSSVWSFGGAGGPLAPDSVEARVQADIGITEKPPPLSAPNAALWVRTKGRGVCALTYERERDGYATVDLSFLAQHFMQGIDGHAIIDWCYAEDPWGVVWAVRDDGKLLSLTLVQQGDGWVWGWALHETAGEVLAICSVPETDEDAVYLVVKRGADEPFFGSVGYYSFERMTSRVHYGTPWDDVCLDAAVKYEGPANVTTLTGLDAFAGRDDVWVIGQNNPPRGPFHVSDNLSDGTYGHLELGASPQLNSGNQAILWIGLKYTPEVETLDAVPDQARERTKNLIALHLEVSESRGTLVGQTFDNLVPADPRPVSAGYGVPSNATQLIRVSVEGGWDSGGRACLRQDLPLPITVVGLTREVDFGGS